MNAEPQVAEVYQTQNELVKSNMYSILESRNKVLKFQQTIKKLRKETGKLEPASLDTEALSKLEMEASKVAEGLDDLDDTVRNCKIWITSYRAERLGFSVPGEAHLEPVSQTKSEHKSSTRLEVDDEKPDKSDDEDKGDEDKPAKRTSKK
jgi:hypothetical protein